MSLLKIIYAILNPEGPACNRGPKVWDALVDAGIRNGDVWLVGGAARCWVARGTIDCSVKDLDFVVSNTSAWEPSVKKLVAAGVVSSGLADSVRNRFSGLKLSAYDPSRGGGTVFVDLWKADVAKYLSECPLSGDGIAVRVSDDFRLFTSEFASSQLPRDHEIEGRLTKRHDDPAAWAAHKESVLKYV